MTNEAETSNKLVFILGYTGEVGKSLVKEINRRKLFKKIVLIGRREVKLDKDLGPEFEQRVVDFNNLNQHKDAFRDLDTGFCCLGTTKGKSGKAGFIQVDHDFVVNSAEVAKTMGCKHFLVVSSSGANKNSGLLYIKTKGEVEEELKAMSFDRLTVLRPGLLLCEREESRCFEACLRCCFKPMPQCIKGSAAISTDELASAMINRVVNPISEQIETIENKQLYNII